jgi:hypothetical protein
MKGSHTLVVEREALLAAIEFYLNAEVMQQHVTVDHFSYDEDRDLYDIDFTFEE